MIKAFITGGAGFIGSHLVDALIDKYDITVYDNLSSGNKEFLRPHLDKSKIKFICGDLLDRKKLQQSIAGHDIVYHLAANSNVKPDIPSTELDLTQGTIATYSVIESMRLTGIRDIVFSSSSVVYGKPEVFPTPENYGPLLPISLYGASKLACESLITAFCHMFNMRCWIFRFANIVGTRQTHGIIFDFLNKLLSNPSELEILGNGKQKKSYLLVRECIEGIILGVEKARDKINVYNLGSTSQVEVDEIANILVNERGLSTIRFRHTGGEGGWPGDVPAMLLDVTKINRLGWKARYNSKEAICQAIKDTVKSKQSSLREGWVLG